MSDILDFNAMPVNYGLVHAFDCNTYVSGDTTWNNSISGNTNATIVGASKYVDGSVYFPPDTGFAYWNTPLERSEITYYFLGKVDSTGTYTGTYRVIFSPCLINSNNIYYLTLSCNDEENIGIWVEDSVAIKPNKSFSDYCVVAVSQFGGKVRMYYNGELVGTVDGIAHNYTHFGIVNNYCTETPPTKGMPYLNTYVKCVIVANSQHSDTEIQKNSNWLLEQYGLKTPEKSSRLAGTDAVAIAYAIARNQESAAALQQLKKAYREGLADGDNGNGEVIEPYETTDPVIDITTGEDPASTDPAVIDLTTTGGLWLKYQNPDDETDIRTVKIYLTDDNDADYASSGYPSSFKGSVIDHKIAADVYDKDGKLIDTNVMLTYSGNISWYYVKKINEGTLIEKIITTKIHIHANNCTVDRDYHYENYSYQTGELSSEGEYQNIDYLSYGGHLDGYKYISCSNIKPQ